MTESAESESAQPESAEQDEWERLDWDAAEEHPMVAGDFQLVVEGVAPVPMVVEFQIRPIGIVPEDYQGVAVRGRPKSPRNEVETPWRIERRTSELPRGRVGYVLLGKTKRAYFPPKEG